MISTKDLSGLPNAERLKNFCKGLAALDIIMVEEEWSFIRHYLAADETELRELTDSAIAKLRRMSDAEYDALDLFPDFEKEDMDAE